MYSLYHHSSRQFRNKYFIYNQCSFIKYIANVRFNKTYMHKNKFSHNSIHINNIHFNTKSAAIC